jgi:hypothetical protein
MNVDINRVRRPAVADKQVDDWNRQIAACLQSMQSRIASLEQTITNQSRLIVELQNRR